MRRACAQDRITCGDPMRPARGCKLEKSWFASLTPAFLCPLPEASFGRGHKKSRTSCRTFFFVPRTGFEPAHLAALPPEGSASTNFATWAVEGKYTARGNNSLVHYKFYIDTYTNCWLFHFLNIP